VDIDTDLFQLLALALGVLSLILLLLVLSGLTRIRKTLEETRGGAWTGGTAAQRSEPTQQAQPAATSYAPQAAATTPVTTATEATPAAATPAASTGTATAGAAGAAAGAGAGAATTAATSGAAEPQDQPFERDGKWWFRRGDELLVYDEGSGQWVPAPATAGASTGFTPIGGAAAATTTQQQPTVGASETGGWKCPSCGAINGATATSCRMCFTPRP
jgi:uncharacterized iron-regulated membrane protein